MSKYSNPEYWEERYRSNNTTFDWFVTFESMVSTLKPLLQPAEQIRVLVAGCGNSRLSACLFDQLNIKKITNVDVSPTVIAQMQRRYSEMTEMQWICTDLLRTSPEKLVNELCPKEYLFDFIIDKGLVDCILGGNNSFHNLYMYNTNMSRLLKKGGRYIVISYGAPQTRLDHFRRKKLSFDAQHFFVDKPLFSSNSSNGEDDATGGHFHIYIMTKIMTNRAISEMGDSDDDEDDFYDRFMTQGLSAS